MLATGPAGSSDAMGSGAAEDGVLVPGVRTASMRLASGLNLVTSPITAFFVFVGFVFSSCSSPGSGSGSGSLDSSRPSGDWTSMDGLEIVESPRWDKTGSVSLGFLRTSFSVTSVFRFVRDDGSRALGMVMIARRQEGPAFRFSCASWPSLKLRTRTLSAVGAVAFFFFFFVRTQRPWMTGRPRPAEEEHLIFLLLQSSHAEPLRGGTQSAFAFLQGSHR
jgi:hypothetical protein